MTRTELSTAGAMVVLWAASLLIGYHAGQKEGSRSVLDKVEEKARVCHTMRSVGINVVAQAAQDMTPHVRGTHFDMVDCEPFYSILGLKEQAIPPVKIADGTLVNVDLKASPSLDDTRR